MVAGDCWVNISVFFLLSVWLLMMTRWPHRQTVTFLPFSHLPTLTLPQPHNLLKCLHWFCCPYVWKSSFALSLTVLYFGAWYTFYSIFKALYKGKGHLFGDSKKPPVSLGAVPGSSRGFIFSRWAYWESNSIDWFSWGLSIETCSIQCEFI